MGLPTRADLPRLGTLALSAALLAAPPGGADARAVAAARTIYLCVGPGGSASVYTRAPRCPRGLRRLSIQAAPGPRGAAGAPGANGPAGPQGPDGATGAPGPRGPSGPAGDVGAPGARGESGPAGPQGPAGAVGATGEVGATGAVGATGEIGATGPAGDTGPAGPEGPQGASGPQGPAGADGAPGATGPQGPAGAQGPSGAPGATGAQGPTGPQGATGPTSSGVADAYATILINGSTPEIVTAASWNAGTTGDVTRPSAGVYCLTALPATVVHVVVSSDTATARIVSAGDGPGTVCTGVAGTDAFVRVRDTSSTPMNLASGDIVTVLAH